MLLTCHSVKTTNHWYQVLKLVLLCNNMSTTILKTPSLQKSGSACYFSCLTSLVKFFIPLKTVEYSVTELGRKRKNPTCILRTNIFDYLIVCLSIPAQEGIMVSSNSGINLCLDVWSKRNSVSTSNKSVSGSL